MTIEITMDEAGMTALRLSPDIAKMIAGVADKVAARGEELAGTATVTTAGKPEQVQVEMRRTTQGGEPLDTPTKSRARSAVLVSHPTPTGRERGMRALLSALDAGATP